MPAKIVTKREILMVAALKVVIATVVTVAGLVSIAYLANMLGLSKALGITLSIIVGVCGFVVGVYWTVSYLVKSGYTETKASTAQK